jgi:CpeT/CpcT family (DUF1001)
MTFCAWLAGEFNNQVQAFNDPTWFVKLRLWYRPLPHLIAGNVAFFAEQANALSLDQPYRQRVAIVERNPQLEQFRLQYCALKRPTDFQGAGMRPALLEALTSDELEPLAGCVLTVSYQNQALHNVKMN